MTAAATSTTEVGLLSSLPGSFTKFDSLLIADSSLTPPPPAAAAANTLPRVPYVGGLPLLPLVNDASLSRMLASVVLGGGGGGGGMRGGDERCEAGGATGGVGVEAAGGGERGLSVSSAGEVGVVALASSLEC